MHRTSWFKFTGEIRPKDGIPQIHASYILNRSTGNISVDIVGASISIQLVADYESFEELFAETVETIQAFLSVQSIWTGMPLQFVINEWLETPLHPLGADGVSHPVVGHVFHETENAPQLSPVEFSMRLAEGIRWSEDMEWNPFLRRAVLDFNYALQHPLNDIPIYLYRAIESAQAFFGGEAQLAKALDAEVQTKTVKKLANDAQGGLHIRHAAKTVTVKTVSLDDVMQAVNATREILVKFQLETLKQRTRSQQEQT